MRRHAAALVNVIAAAGWVWLPGWRRRRALMVLVIALGACGPAPSPSEQPPTPVPSATLVATPVTPTRPTTEPTTSPISFSFDVENRASVGVIVSVASDTAATMPGFEPGQRGTISIALLNPENGISVEIQGSECRLLASAMYPTPVPFTLLVENGPEPGAVKLSTRAGTSRTPMPLPSNSLIGCGG
jgi:hypothetical protein